MDAAGSTPTKPAVSDLLWNAIVRHTDAPNMLVDAVYRTLWTQIVEGDRQQGERLSDVDLAAELGVSRTPVRQALHQLQRTGLVQTSAKRGFHVTIFSEQDVRELYDMRAILEVAAVRAATPHIAEARLSSALSLISELRTLHGEELNTAFFQSDIELHHDLIAQHNQNRRLAAAIADLRAQLGIFLISSMRAQPMIVDALDGHEAILRALLDRDVERAAAAMEDHIQTSKLNALRAFAQNRRPTIRTLRLHTNTDQS